MPTTLYAGKGTKLVATNQVFEFAIRQLLNGQRVVNTYHFSNITATDTTQAECLAVANDCKELMRPSQVPDLTYDTWTARQVDGTGVTFNNTDFTISGGAVWEGSFTGTLTGGLTGNVANQQSALVMATTTGLAGRSKRGRVYFGGLAIANQPGTGLWASALITAANTRRDTFIAKYGAGGTDANFQWCVWSFLLTTGWKPNPSPPPAYVQAFAGAPGASYWAVTAAPFRTTVFTQRRRVIGVGS